MTPRINDYILYDDETTSVKSINYRTEPRPRLIRQIKFSDDGSVESETFLGRNDREECVTVEYVYNAERNTVTTIERWISDDDSVFAEETNTEKLSTEEYCQLEHDNKQTLINKLKVKSEKWEKEGYFDDIIDFFSPQIFTFLQTGSRVVVKAINDTLDIVISDLPQEERARVRNIQNILNDTFNEKTIAQIVKAVFNIRVDED